MDDMNPYEVLGLGGRGATDAQIKYAYRGACKNSHPDAGGDPGEFERITLARDILLDPDKRRTYDETGRIDQPMVNNDRAAALQVVERHLADIINTFVNSAFKAEFDPRKMDVPKIIIGRIQKELQDAEVGLVGGAKIVKFFQDMGERFSVEGMAAGEEDTIARSFKRSVVENERRLAELRHSIEVHKLAIEIARKYRYRMDPPSPEDAYHAGRVTAYTWPTAEMADMSPRDAREQFNREHGR